MSQRPNIYDVARVAGVSRTVVSLVTNGKADQYRIARETQDRVRAAVRQTGYVPNFFIRDIYLKRRAISQAGGAGAVSDLVKVAAVINQALASAGYQMKVSSLSADQNTSLLLLLGPTTSTNPSPLPSSVAPICDRSPSSPAPVATQPKPVIPPSPAPVIVPLPIPVVPAPTPAPVIAPPQPTPVPAPPPETPEPSTPPPSEREGGDSSPPSFPEPVIAEPSPETLPPSSPEPTTTPTPEPIPEPIITPEPTPVIVLPVESPPPPEPIPAPPIVIQGEGGDSPPPSSPEPVIAEPPPDPLLPSSPASSTTTLP